MSTQDVALTRFFADLPDPRIDRTKRHRLLDILAITVCATIAGADTWEEVERFGKAKRDWLGRFLELPNGIPSHDTFNRVFAALDPRKFNECVTRWLAAVCQAAGLRHVAIDGKSARSAPRDTFSGRLHLVSAWASENRLILGLDKQDRKDAEFFAIDTTGRAPWGDIAATGTISLYLPTTHTWTVDYAGTVSLALTPELQSDFSGGVQLNSRERRSTKLRSMRTRYRAQTGTAARDSFRGSGEPPARVRARWSRSRRRSPAAPL